MPLPADQTTRVTAPQRPALVPEAVSPDADPLLARVLGELAASWRSGTPRLAEEFLVRHTELAADPEQAVRLIYEEVCLRQEAGQSVPADQFLARFPRWRDELGLLLDCHNLMESRPAVAHYPEPGEALGDFKLLTCLGRGVHGNVFLATQPALADRPVVLKLAVWDGAEHLSLARLQHTHIVPLFAVYDFPWRNLRGLCMPYLGGTTLAQALDGLRDVPPAERTGKQLLEQIDRGQARSPVRPAPAGPARLFLEQASYVQAVCWMGCCLADALQYAHERRLVHLDIKPSNVLLAADGQPMLLDFHLAREPIVPHGPAPESFGGTPLYMSPEQEIALNAVSDGRPVTSVVDGRSDVYSLGILLYEALGGTFPVDARRPSPLPALNPEVSRGLADLLHRAIAPDPADRYADAAAFAADLRRHLAHRPLEGVPNRSLHERWSKWRRRRPHGLAVAVSALCAVIALAAVGASLTHIVDRKRQDAEAALADGRRQLADQDYEDAVATLERGAEQARSLPWTGPLGREIESELRLARRAALADQLHSVADAARFLLGADTLSRASAEALERECRAVWQRRDHLTEAADARLPAEREARIRSDLLDLAVLGADLHVRLAPSERAAEARREATALLSEAEAALGTTAILRLEREAYARAPGQGRPGAASASALPDASTPGESFALGRLHLRSGDVRQALAAFDQALESRPEDFWSQFYKGVCAYRLGRHPEALLAFSVCVALRPNAAPCYYNRGLAAAALGRTAAAVRDYDRALELDPTLAAAALNRGVAQRREKHYAAAVSDLERALQLGADPATVYFNLAVMQFDRQDFRAARQNAQRALQHAPDHRGARELLARLQARR